VATIPVPAFRSKASAAARALWANRDRLRMVVAANDLRTVTAKATFQVVYPVGMPGAAASTRICFQA
jgi:hypothetical protein